MEQSRQQGHSHKFRRRLLFLISFFILSAALLHWSNTALQTTVITVIDDQIPKSFHNYTIVQISDLHNASFGTQQKTLLTKIAACSPHLIAITGDLIDSNHPNLTAAMELIHGAVNIAPVYYVTGNHEAWNPDGYAQLKQQMEDAGVVILEDQVVPVIQNNEMIYLLGMNDPAFMQTGSPLANNFKKLISLKNMAPGYTILLSHRPELFSVYCKAAIHLVLSGHAHGGQIRLPLLGGLIAPNQGFLPSYTSGLYQKDKTNMVVSRGLGNSIIPLRILNRPEIVTIKLQASA